MSEKKWHELNDQVKADGYVWEGSVELPSYSCEEECCCPMCGRGGYFCVWYILPSDASKEAWTNRCYECGHIWREDVDRFEIFRDQESE